MTQLQHFHVPIQMQGQRRSNQKNNRNDRVSMNEGNDDDKVLALYYDNEFRKWHYKLVLIIAFIIAGLFAVLIGLSKLY